MLREKIRPISHRYRRPGSPFYYDKGALVHALADNEQGTDAPVSIADWTEGEFEFRNATGATARSIDVDLHRALMQALKIRDERKKKE